MIRETHKLGLALAVLVVSSAARPAAAADAGSDEALQNLPLGKFVDAISLEQLAGMVVTDTKVAQATTSVTQNMVVLHRDDLERQPEVNRNLAEFMRYTAGQFVNVLSRNDANWGSYGGLGPKYNSYLLDGLPIDSFVDAMSLDSEAIERIEVQKGPASVLYSSYLTMDFAGNETPLAGTTNFVLKDRIETPLTRVSAGFGSYGTYAGRAYHQGRSGNLSYLLGAVAEHSDYTQYGVPGSWLQTVKSPEYDKSKLFAKLGYALDRPDHNVSIFLHQTSHDGDVGRPNRDFDNRYDTVNFAYNNQFTQSLHLQFKVGERRYRRQSGNDDYTNTGDLASTSHDDTRQVIRPMDLTLSYLHGKDSLLTAGIDHQTVHYETASRSNAGIVTPANDIDARSIGYFLQEKVQWRDWVFRAGVRHNVIRHEYSLLDGNVPATTSNSWSKNLWSLGVRYNMAPSFFIYANAGSSFMAPAGKQIGGTVGTTNRQLPNPFLKPESGIGRDIGFDWRPTRTLNIGARAFLNTISNAIVDNVVSVTPSQTRSENAGSARATGVELDWRHSLSNSAAWFANVTYTRTSVQNPGSVDQDGSHIPFAPDKVINLGLTAKLPLDITVSPYFHWVGRYYDSTSRTDRASLGNYGVVNVRLQQNVRRGVELVIDLNNIGNRRYDMPFGFRDPGFSGLTRLNFTF